MEIGFHRNYFLWFIFFLTTETIIVLFLKTGFIRHTFGYFLVVMLLYCLLKSFRNAKPLTIGSIVLLVAYGIEFLQLFNLLEYLNLIDSKTAQIILGNTFQITDFFAYTFGILTILIIEHQLKPQQ